ncbi:hypothetical protein D9615_008119 [Tricholomella constricta]|uniref:Uncharacterized protein n=1 Tax=Tricholomella constricta TaxID=117010 RepID=A0A8H5GVF1_9AGAR|nr:hypothetical protein D9615_008119 [Tricholomella constricta]
MNTRETTPGTMNRPRPYQLAELVLLNSRELRALIDKQPDQWPSSVRLNSTTNKKTHRKQLLNPDNGFSTDEPLTTDDVERTSAVVAQSLTVVLHLRSPSMLVFMAPHTRVSTVLGVIPLSRAA